MLNFCNFFYKNALSYVLGFIKFLLNTRHQNGMTNFLRNYLNKKGRSLDITYLKFICFEEIRAFVFGRHLLAVTLTIDKRMQRVFGGDSFSPKPRWFYNYRQPQSHLLTCNCLHLEFCAPRISWFYTVLSIRYQWLRYESCDALSSTHEGCVRIFFPINKSFSHEVVRRLSKCTTNSNEKIRNWVRLLWRGIRRSHMGVACRLSSAISLRVRKIGPLSILNLFKISLRLRNVHLTFVVLNW